ncbi:MAG: class I SAM-dependent methyltransferase [Kiloniellales bacterium]|nr:class I SAM-dependent methyltransferase [Kiloniellales bacterium]
MERQVYERMAAIEDRHWWFVARRRILDEVLSRLVTLPDKPRILEAGCGTGGNLGLLGRHGRVSAFEPDETARRLAAAKGEHEILGGSLPDGIPYPARSFDLVAALDILEHVEDDRGSLHRLYERLRPGGWLMLTVPAFPFLWSRHDELHHHRRRYRRQELLDKLQEANFEAAYVTHFNVLLFPLIAAVRLVNGLLGARGSDDERVPAAPINALLTALFAGERHWIGRLSCFFGVSLLVLARRPG